jgi:DnaJ-class molecular chaperone
VLSNAQMKCLSCEGKNLCEDCNGHGSMTAESTTKIKIPSYLTEESKIVVPGAGQEPKEFGLKNNADLIVYLMYRNVKGFKVVNACSK